LKKHISISFDEIINLQDKLNELKPLSIRNHQIQVAEVNLLFKKVQEEFEKMRPIVWSGKKVKHFSACFPNNYVYKPIKCAKTIIIIVFTICTVRETVETIVNGR